MQELDCHELYADATFYEDEFADRIFELPFYERLAEKTGSPILEVACGTGRLTIPLADAGHEIVGLDISEPMLSLAKRKTDRQGLTVRYVLQDCRTMDLGQKFNLIFSATNSMQHLLDNDSVAAYLTSAAAHLAQNGVLVIDVMNPNVGKLARGPENPYLHKTYVDAEGAKIEVEAASCYLADRQILHFELTYRRAGQKIKVKSVNMRCFFPLELRALCQQCKLEIVEEFGDYDESPFSPDCPRQLLLCRPSEEA